jgi:SNF2 family DNA or RNA helicase
VADVVFPRSPLTEFRELLRKSGKTVRDQVAEEEGRFIFSPEYAREFLEKNMGSIVTSFALYQAETLGRYRIRYASPSIRLKLDHGIDFLEGSASVVIDEISWPWMRFLSEYRKAGFISLQDGTRVFLEQGAMSRIEGLLHKARGGSDDDEERVEISFFDLTLFDLQKEVTASPELLRRIESFYLGFNTIPGRDGDFSLAESSLRPYQKYGVQWMEHLGDHGIGGCLADEMGLGKTVQVISLLRRAYASGLSGPSLIISPKSLIWNWASELRRFAPELPVHIHYGIGRDSGGISFRENRIILTTYTTTRIDIEELASVEFAYLVLDESQHIKNLNAKRTMAILGLTARRRFALSGTPVENNLSELYSRFRFLNPSFFGSRGRFSREYGKALQEDHDVRVLKDLKRKIYPFMLRRLKQEVLTDLPEKSEQVLLVDLDKEHLEVNHRRRAYFAERIKQAIEEKGFFKASFIILQALGELRRLAGIPEDDGEYLERSAKRDQLLEMVREIRENGHKCLIFTNFLAAVEMIASDLTEAGISNLVMTGATGNRQELVHRFQTDSTVGAFIMTLKTGGVGLNLTAADYVFIFDPWWNSAAESQGIDRTHRIGQKNPVFCYRLIARDTIEEKILLLQQRKAELTSSLFSSDSEAMKSLSEEDIRFLLEG